MIYIHTYTHTTVTMSLLLWIAILCLFCPFNNKMHHPQFVTLLQSPLSSQKGGYIGSRLLNRVGGSLRKEYRSN